ncbi:MAG: DUF222 domain-containing protein [Ilumatobacteraceae bacterium]
MASAAATELMETELGAWPGERLEEELVTHAAREAVGTARMLGVLAEVDRRRLWADWGCRSAVHWLSWKCSLSLPAGTERVRVAHDLRELPVIATRFGEGRLCWSKVRAITRVARPHDETGWADIAEAATAGQLDRLVRAARYVRRSEVAEQDEMVAATWETNPNGSVTVTLTLPADRAAQVLASLDAATVPERGVPRHRSRAAAMEGLLIGSLRPAGETIVHVDGHGCRDEHGIPIHPALADQFSCGHPVTTVAHDVLGPDIVRTQPAPSNRQRRRLAARHRTCQFPGCHHDGDFDAHHVIERRRGGPTALWNLVRLCRFHHRLVHLHGLLLTLHPDRSLTVVWPDGTPLDRGPDADRLREHASRLDEAEQRAIADPHRITGVWDGRRLA